MRILQVFNRYLKPGGEENSVARIARHLESGGHEVERFWRASEEWQGEAAPPRWKQAILLGNNKPVLQQLLARHREFKPDIWILHNVIPVISLGVYGLARELGVPIIQWLHNYRPISPSGAGERKAYFSETIRGAWRGSRIQTGLLAWHYARVRRRGDFEAVKAWVAVSDAMRQTFAAADWFPDRLATLHHSWDIGEDPGQSENEGFFLYLGRLIEEKGIRFLIELFARPELRDVKLKVAGRGDLESELRAISTSNVEWVGWVEGEEKRSLIRGSCAVLFPSLWREPLSTVAYEAYEQRRPIFTSSSGGMREIVEDRVTGRVLNPGDQNEWSSAICGSASGWGDAGRDWLESNVSPERWNEQFASILRERLNADEPSFQA
ncbi:MAG: glycosyltransferase involved in cell wall biosynthesis [Verrucomicrobiales bacterium]|jgi:glycosyltransferase involved in cell wall biosynthesis